MFDVGRSSGPTSRHLSSLQCVSDGALCGRPDSCQRMRKARCLDNVWKSTCLVSISAGLSRPGSFSSVQSLDRTLSWIQRSATAKCRTFPNPPRRHIPIAAVASVSTVSWKVKPRPLHKDWSPIPREAPRQIPLSSASPLETATVVCVVDQRSRVWAPRSTQPPDVDLLIS